MADPGGRALRTRFDELADEWAQETRFQSSSDREDRDPSRLSADHRDGPRCPPFHPRSPCSANRALVLGPRGNLRRRSRRTHGCWQGRSDGRVVAPLGPLPLRRRAAFVDSQLGMASERIEVPVAVKNRDTLSYCDSGNEAVQHAADSRSLPPAASIERGGVVIVGPVDREQGGSREQLLQTAEVRLVSRACKHLHPHDLARGQIAIQQFVNEVAHGRARVAQELYPGRRVSKNHGMRLARISSRSPSQPLPRMARASSREARSAATVRKAKLIASRFVARS